MLKYHESDKDEQCDTEDWSNDAENSALITGINYILQKKKKYIYIYIYIFLWIVIIFHNITILLYIVIK